MSDNECAEQLFVYDAFISYRRVDRDTRWAEWLVDALEQYQIPKVLQKRGLSNKSLRIFRDEDELSASADLSDQVKAALKTSRFLIVICSAFTPRSRWVQREIEIFKELGRGDQVLGLLTEGEPDDCFPAHMLERYQRAIGLDGGVHTVKKEIEPLAADVRPHPNISNARRKRTALLRLVAPILGVSFDDLQERERGRLRAWQLKWASVAAGLILLAAAGAVGFWETSRTITTHYRHIVWRWGLPTGLDQIDEETRNHAAESYRFTMRHGKVLEVRRESSGGALKAEDSGEGHWLISYGQNEHSSRIQVFDSNDRLIREEQNEPGSSSNSLITNFKRDNIDFAQTGKLPLLEIDSKGDITREERTLNEQGYAIQVRYQNHYGVPQHDIFGSYGQNMIKSADGLLLRAAWVGLDNEEITSQDGVRATAFTYDAKYNLERTTLIGSDDKAFEGTHGYSYFVSEHDHWGNTVTTSYYAIDESPALNTEGYSKLTRTYDSRGNDIEAAYYGLDEKPTLGKDSCAIVRAKFDNRGNKIEVACFGLDGQAVLNRDGVARIEYGYDSHDRVTETAFYGLRGEPTFGSYGAARYQQQYDDAGNLLEQGFFGLRGELVTHSQFKVAKVRESYNGRGQVISEKYFDIDDNPTANVDGIASKTFAYDQRGNPVEFAFFGIDGKPTSDNGFNCARVRAVFDDNGFLTGQYCFGTDGDLTLSYLGWAHLTTQFDDHGNLTKIAYFGLKGSPPVGDAGFLFDYDRRGNIVKTTAIGVDGIPKEDSRRIAITKRRYNTRNQIIRMDYFDLAGNPTLGTIGCASELTEYDNRGRAVAVTCLGFNGEITNRIEGYAKQTTAYDSRGNTTQIARFDAEGKPVAGSKSGWARVFYTYDSRNIEIGAVYLDKLGREIPVDVVFIDIDPGSTAERIGLVKGDRVLSYDGKKPTSDQQQLNLVSDYSGHPTRILIVRRGAQTLTFMVGPGRLGAAVDVVPAEVDVVDTVRLRRN
jgi:hypothetical protein